MNFVAGTLLLFLDEEEAFYCLCALVEDILPGYYAVDMVATQVRGAARAAARLVGSAAAWLQPYGAD